MKKVLLMITTLLSTSIIAHAQWTTSGNNIYNTNTGAIGIGTTTPSGKLQVNGTIVSVVSGAGGDNNNIMISNPAATSQISDIRAGIWLDNDGRLKFRNTTGYGVAFRSQSNTTDIMNVTDAGVSIGTQATPAGYKFAVNGSVIASSVVIKQYANWPDYVFNTDYSLMPLPDIRAYIDQNHHLPEIPSEQEVAQNGINLGEMNRLLLKKVEELTLYMIEKDKKDKELEVSDKKNTREIASLKKRLQKLTTKRIKK